jgi:hypothetical protein
MAPLGSVTHKVQCGHATLISCSWCLLFNESKLLLSVALTTSVIVKGPLLSTITQFFVQLEKALEIYFTFVSNVTPCCFLAWVTLRS